MLELEQFWDRYKVALALWCNGMRDVEFPPGTYKMRVLHGGADGALPLASAGIRPVEGGMAPNRRSVARRDDEAMQSIVEEEQRSHGAAGQARTLLPVWIPH